MGRGRINVQRRTVGLLKRDGIIRTQVEGMSADAGMGMDGHFRATCPNGSGASPWTLWFLPDPSRPEEKIQLLEGLDERTVFDALKALKTADVKQLEFRKSRDAALMRLLGRE